MLRIEEVLGEDGSDFSVSVGLEDVATLLEDETKFLVCGVQIRQLGQKRNEANSDRERTVGNDTVVDDGEFLVGIGNVRVTVESC